MEGSARAGPAQPLVDCDDIALSIQERVGREIMQNWDELPQVARQDLWLESQICLQAYYKIPFSGDRCRSSTGSSCGLDALTAQWLTL